MMDEKIDGFAKGARPLCGFCNAPWTDDMIQTLHYTSVTTGYYDAPEDIEMHEKIDIHCASCERLIYRKEIQKTISAYGGDWEDYWQR